MKALQSVILGSILTFTCLLSATSDSSAICQAIAGSASCNPNVPCLGTGKTAWTVSWSNQSGCGCDRIEVWADENCDGSFTLVTTLTNCSQTSYNFCGNSGSSYTFKIVYKNGTQQTVADITTPCVTCP